MPHWPQCSVVPARGVDAAVKEVRPLLAARGFGTPIAGPRLATLADVFAYAQANDVVLRLDGTEIRVRRGEIWS